MATRSEATGSGVLERYLKISRFRYPVPHHARSLPYTLGGIAFVGFVLLFASGFVLTQFYNPAPERAYDSVRHIVERVPGGAWVRAFHYWAAQAAVLALLLHLLRVFVTGAYKAPRLLTWYVGLALLGIALFGSYFTGTVLKWDQESFDALIHYREGLAWLGPLGRVLGSDEIVSVNVKLYVSHISILPLLLVLVVIAHFYLINVHNLSPLPFGEDSSRATLPRERMTGQFLEHSRAILFYSAVYYGTVALLAWWIPAPLGPPVTGEEMSVKPPWPFLWLYGLENLSGRIDTMYYALAILFTLLAVLPVLDRGPERHPARRPVVMGAGALFLLGVIALTVYAAIAPPQQHEHEHGLPPSSAPSPAPAEPGEPRPHDDTDHPH